MNLKQNVGWIRCVFCTVIHRFGAQTVDYGAKNAPNPPYNTRKINGFTLLEIIIALFIFSIVSIIVVSALHNVLTTQAALDKKTARLAELQFALLLLSRDLEQTINRPVINAKNTAEGFIGTAHTVTFTHAGFANPFGQLPRSTLQRTRYVFQQNTLIRQTWPTLDLARAVNPDARLLLKNVTEFHFDYLDAKKQFQPTWPPRDQPQAILPLAVRVSLTLSNWGKIIQLYIIPGQPLEKTN